MKWQVKSNATPIPVPEYVDDGNGWDTRSDLLTPPTRLTEKERDRLIEKAGTPRIDRVRAQRVKELMNKKKSVRQIHAALKHFGRGYSLRSITTVHAALNPSPTGAIGEGCKKRSNSRTATHKFKVNY